MPDEKTATPPVAPISNVPTLRQMRVVQRNPLVPSSIEPRGDVRATTVADPTKEYVPSGANGYYPFLRALTHAADDLTQKFGLKVYENMMADPVVFASERVFTLAVLANGWDIVPSLSNKDPDYDVAVKMADFVKDQLTNLRTPYDVVLEQQLNAFENGCSVEELVWELWQGQLRLHDMRDKPLDHVSFVVDSYNNTIAMMTQRFPGQIFPAGTWVSLGPLSASNTELPSEQDKKGEYNLSDHIPGMLPRDLFSVLTHQMRYNDERGRSGLRPAYSAWWFKQQVLAEYLSWLTKFASPSLVGTTAQNETEQAEVDENLNMVEDAAGNPKLLTPQQLMSDALTQFANGTAIAIPFGAKVEAIVPSGGGEGFTKALNYANSEITRAMTYQFLATSEGEHQSRAAADTHQDILTLGFFRRKLWLAGQQRREVYRKMLMYNFDITGKHIERYIPNLQLGEGSGFPLSISDISSLASAQYLDPSQYEAIDKRVGLPQREMITVNGARMSPNQVADQQREDQQAEQQQQAAQEQGGGGGLFKAANIAPQPVVVQPAQAPNITVNVPDVKVEMPRDFMRNVMKGLTDRMVINVPQAPAPNVVVHVDPTPVQIAAPVINVDPTPVTVQNNVPAPIVNNNVKLPTLPAPNVTVAMPHSSEETVQVERDNDGRIKRVLKKIIWGE